MVLILTILIATPLITERLATLGQSHLLARAEATALVYGPPGSELDLALNALFFTKPDEPGLQAADYDALLETGLALPLPILQTQTARGFPIIATDIEYFDYRQLELSAGRRMTRIGEVVAGAEVAAELALMPGDELQSDADLAFDLAAAYPVRMEVVGVLAKSGGPDDRAVFTDMRTGLVIAGYGHGHDDLSKSGDQSVVLKHEPGRVVANAKLQLYVDLIDSDPASIHFHGDPASFPLTTIILEPKNARSAALLRGRIEDAGETRQVFRPIEAIRELVDEIFRIKAILDMLTSAVSIAALVAIAMIVWLSTMLRTREAEIARRLGADRGRMAFLITAELAMLCAIAISITAVLTALIDTNAEPLAARIILGA